jgi:hypothetical protein
MGSRKQYIEKLLAITKLIGMQTYAEVKEKYSLQFEEKLKSHVKIYDDFSVESRLDKKNIPEEKKEKLKNIIRKLKDQNYVFTNDDVLELDLFTSSIDSTVNHNQYISNIKNGKSNYLLGKTGIEYNLDIVALFNEIKHQDTLADFFTNSKLNKVFVEQGNFKSFLTVLFVICKNCQNKEFPLYYKYYQGIVKWCYDIPRGDYDSFMQIYNSTHIIDTPKAIAFDTYYHFLGIEIKNEVEKQGLANTIQDRNFLDSEIFNYPDESFKFITNELSDIQLKFKNWLTINISKSADKYFSYFNTSNIISENSDLGNLYKWTEEDWSDKEKELRNLPDFIEKNTKGHNNLTASIAAYKKFIKMENSNIEIPPQIPFPNFKWRWAVTTPSESINSQDIIFGVLKILVKHNGKRHATQEFKDDLLKLQNDTNSPIGLAKIDRDLKKNIVENSGQYWKALGLLNSTNDGTISVTDIGLGIVNGSLSKEDYIKYLYDNFNLPNQNIESETVIQTYSNANIRIYPIKIIFQVLYSISKSIQSPAEWYLTPDELKDIVVPLSIYQDIEYELYAEYILSYRNDKSLFTKWPNVTPKINDFRMLQEYLIFLSNFGYIDLVELKDKSKRYYINELTLNIINGNLSQTNHKQIKPVSTNQISFDSKIFETHTKKAGLIFSPQLIQRFVASLCTKPFVICSGLSGSGKTKLAQAFAQWICYKEKDGEKNEQYCIVPVGADWTNREPLLGYPNALQKEEYVTPENGVLDLMVRAKNEYDIYKTDNSKIPKPYFLILDEMNLSHVERYFADFLSTMESGDNIPIHKILPEPTKDLITIPQTLKLPKNLFIIGTVNIDETTYMFSPKVLDRANTIEFRLTEKDLADFIESDKPLRMELLTAQGANMSDGFMAMALKETDKNLKSSEADLKLFFTELKKSGAEFGYRTASEIGRLMYILKELGESDDSLLDIAIMQKLLPKLHGSRNKLTKVLPILGGFCLSDNSKIKEDYLDPFLTNSLTEVELKADSNVKYKISFEKICRMYKNAVENGFASYAEA